jgi:hypothetical protein
MAETLSFCIARKQTRASKEGFGAAAEALKNIAAALNKSPALERNLSDMGPTPEVVANLIFMIMLALDNKGHLARMLARDDLSEWFF